MTGGSGQSSCFDSYWLARWPAKKPRRDARNRTCGRKLRNSFLVVLISIILSGTNSPRSTPPPPSAHALHLYLSTTRDSSSADLPTPTSSIFARGRVAGSATVRGQNCIVSLSSGPSVRTTEQILCQHASRAARGRSILGDVDGGDDDGLHRLVARHRLHALDRHHHILAFDHLSKHLTSRDEVLRLRSRRTDSELGMAAGNSPGASTGWTCRSSRGMSCASC